MSVIIFDKKYNSESIIDLDGDLLDVEDNALFNGAERDEHGFVKGTFRVIVEWTKEE